MTTKQATRRGAFDKAAKVGERRGALPNDPGRKELRQFMKAFGNEEGAKLFTAGADYRAELKKRGRRPSAFEQAVTIGARR